VQLFLRLADLLGIALGLGFTQALLGLAHVFLGLADVFLGLADFLFGLGCLACIGAVGLGLCQCGLQAGNLVRVAVLLGRFDLCLDGADLGSAVLRAGECIGTSQQGKRNQGGQDD